MNLPSISSNLKAETKGLDFSRYTTFGAPIAAIVVSLIVLVVVVIPRFSQALKVRSSDADLASRVNALNQKSTLLSGLDESQLQDELKTAEEAVPSDKSIFPIVRQIETTASQNGVILDKVDVSPGALSDSSAGASPSPAPNSQSAGTQTTSAAPSVEVKISTTSDYRSFLKFLSALYTLPRVVSIGDLTLGATGSSLNVDIVIDAYWKALPTQLGSVETPLAQLTAQEQEVLKNVQAAEATNSAATSSAIPDEPTGRNDLFAPF